MTFLKWSIVGGLVTVAIPIVLHLLNVLQQKNARRGMASLCIGGGQGGAMLIERPVE